MVESSLRNIVVSMNWSNIHGADSPLRRDSATTEASSDATGNSSEARGKEDEEAAGTTAASRERPLGKRGRNTCDGPTSHAVGKTTQRSRSSKSTTPASEQTLKKRRKLPVQDQPPRPEKYKSSFSAERMEDLLQMRFRQAVHDHYKMKNYEDVEQDPNTFRLKVGDAIEVKEYSGPSWQAQIVDFRRGGLVLSWNPAESSAFVPMETLLSSAVYRCRVVDVPKKKFDKHKHSLWVRRNPTLSRDLIAKKRNAAIEMNPELAKQGVVQVLGVGEEKDYPWTKLEEIPEPGWRPDPLAAEEGASWEDVPTVHRVPCPFCNEELEAPAGFRWSTAMHEHNRLLPKGFEDHCKEKHEGQVLAGCLALTRTYHAKAFYGTLDRLQWSLLQAYKEKPLPLSAVEILLRKYDQTPLRANLTYMLGYAAAANEKGTNLRKITPFKANNNKYDYEKFTSMVSKLLRKITERFMTFDFACLEPPTRPHRALVIWNHINLFFIRGFFTEGVFPPLIGLQFEDFPPPIVEAKAPSENPPIPTEEVKANDIPVPPNGDVQEQIPARRGLL